MKQLRIGVAARLIAGLVLMALLTGLAAGVAIFSYSRVLPQFDQVTETDVPDLLQTAQLDRESARLFAYAPILALADSLPSWEESRDAIEDHLKALAALEQALAQRGVRPEGLKSLRIARETLRNSLESIELLAADRVAADKAVIASQRRLAVLAGKLRRLVELPLPRKALGRAGAGLSEAEARAVARLALARWSLAAQDALAQALAALSAPHNAALRERKVPFGVALATLQRHHAALPPKLQHMIADRQREVLTLLSEEVFALRASQVEARRDLRAVLTGNKLAADTMLLASSTIRDAMQARVSDNRDALNQALETGTLLLGGLFALCVVGAGLIILYIHRNIIRRLNGLRQSMQAEAAGQPAAIAVGGNDEIADMAASVKLFAETIRDRERELHRKTRLLEATLAHIDQGIVMADENMTIQAHNRRFAELFDFKGAQLTEGCGFDALLRDWAERVGMSKTALAGRLVELRARTPLVSEIPLPDGRLIESRHNPLPEGGMVRTYTDRTEQRQAERAIQRSEAQLRGVFEASPIGIGVLRPKDQLVFANPCLARLFKCDVSALMATPFHRLIASPKEMERLGRVIEAQGSVADVEMGFQRLDGSLFWALFTLEPSEFQGESVRLFWVYDITARREAENERRRTLSLLRAALDSTADGMIVIASGGQIVTWNNHFQALWHLPEEWYAETTPRQVRIEMLAQRVKEGDAIRRMLWRLTEALEEQATETVETREGRFLECHSLPYRTQEGIVGRVWSFRDITGRVRSEQALRLAKEEAEQALEELRDTKENLVQAEKMASLGSLVAGIAHEVNTPVGIGLTGATFITRRIGEVQEAFSTGTLRKSDLKEFFGAVTEAAGLLVGNLDKAAALIQGFKQVAVDQTSGERRHFDLKVYIEEILLSLRPRLKKTPHQVIVDCPDDIKCDSFPGALSSVLTNLVMNSLIHGFGEVDANGERTAEHRSFPGHIRLTVRKCESDWVEITHTDDGSGIKRENLDKIFDPFFTTRRGRGGSGLGLNIVYNLVTRSLGGKITVDSEPGEGTKFTLRFPCVAPTADES